MSVTEFLDLKPLPVTALRNPCYETLYDDSFKQFNPIQTQAFSVLYNTDDNVLVAAPTGSGKTICAEFAILRNHQKLPKSAMRVVYIAAFEAVAKERYRDWEEKFGKRLGMFVVELTGETATDLTLLEKGRIIISTPEKWDALSRNWKDHKYIQHVTLFIVDDFHLIGEPVGPVLEIVVSRMRRIAIQTNMNIRIVALSASLANAKDVGEWIGATSHGLFDFPPGDRPVPLEIHIQGVDIENFEARMQAMLNPTHAAIVDHAKNGKPALVFVPTIEHARLTPVVLCACPGVKSAENLSFLLGTKDEMESFISRIKEETLKETLRLGVGYLHEGLCDSDQEVVKQLFFSSKIQVCVASSSMCWGMSLPAHLVVVMGTQYYDRREKAHTDYPFTDLLQMMGHASRPLIDSSGKCVILCHAPRKEYYKKSLCEAFPVESHLHHLLHDHMNAEVVAVVVKNKSDAVDYLRQTFMFRRLTKNPNYYNLQGVSHKHLSEYLFDLIKNTFSDLESSKCIIIEEDKYFKPSNLGLIASKHYVSHFTMAYFYYYLYRHVKVRDLLKILTCSFEYSRLQIHPGDDDLMSKFLLEEGEASKSFHYRRDYFEKSEYPDPHVKANALLQAYVFRDTVVRNLTADQREVLLLSYRLLQAMIDVIASNGWLVTAIVAMKLCQRIAKGIWERDSTLLQLPHFTKELAKRCQENPGKSIKTVFDLIEMENDKIHELLQVSDAQMLDIVQFCKRFPRIRMTYKVLDADNILPGLNVTLEVTLVRDRAGWTEAGLTHASHYPKPKEEGWWLFVGHGRYNKLLAIKRVVLQNSARVNLVFEAPKVVGRKLFSIFLISESYQGCDQEYEFRVNVHKLRLGFLE